MVTYQKLVDRVAAREGVGGADDARRAVQAVVAALAPRVGTDLRVRIGETLPPSLAAVPEGERPGRPAESGDIARDVGRALDCPPEQGLHLAQIVLSEIAESAPELGEELTRTLPAELAEWTSDPVGAAGRADAGATDRPSRLDEETLRATRERLPEWQGGTRGLTRVVQLPKDRLPPLVNRVDRIGQELGHPAHHETTGDGIAFTVRTASVEAVTTRDIELAERIDQAVAEVASGG